MTIKRRELLQRAAVMGAGAAAVGTGASLINPEVLAFASSAGKPLSSFRFVTIVKTVASPYWAIVLAAAKHAAKDLGVTGLKYTGGPSEADIAAEVSLLENAIAQKPDFIVCAPTDKTALNATIAKAYNAGIKVILIDSDGVGAPRTSFLSTDNFHAGTLCADALAASIKAKTGSVSGKIAYATFQSNVGSLTLRDNGFLAGIKKYSGLTIVAHKDGAGDASELSAVSAASNTIAAHPDLVGYFGDNLQMVEGAAKAFKEKGVSTKKVSLIGFDSDPTLVAELQAGQVDGLLLQDPYMMGYGGVWYGVLASIGIKLPLFLDTGATVATPKTANSPLVEGLLSPLGKPGRGLGL
ncbi:MAG TPA: substrate-binding domain-containing protein [Chloroflexota bacterium]|jgi:ribose transport system substrate-binding protein